MVLTREEKNRIIKVLLEAKPFVAIGYVVCGAAARTSCNRENVHLTQRYVQSLIAPRMFVTGWLKIHYGIYLDIDQAVEYRKQWVDHMIEELRK